MKFQSSRNDGVVLNGSEIRPATGNLDERWAVAVIGADAPFGNVVELGEQLVVLGL